MPPLNLLIKPASGSCNMACRYCFYADETEKRSVPLMGRMSRETMHRIVDRALAYADGDCTFSFRGDILLETCRRVLDEEYPEYADRICLTLPDEKFRRVGQSMAAASLPEMK